MLQSVPVLTQSVRSAESATLARGSPFAVTSGSRNLSGSSGRVAGAAMTDTRRWLLVGKDRYAGWAPAVTADSLSQLLVGAARPRPAAFDAAQGRRGRAAESWPPGPARAHRSHDNGGVDALPLSCIPQRPDPRRRSFL